MQWFNKLFKKTHYTSEIDSFVTELNQAGKNNTPGKVAKINYYRTLIKQRGKLA